MEGWKLCVEEGRKVLKKKEWCMKSVCMEKYVEGNTGGTRTG